jgi:SAM-dependent methyltransferase
LALLLAFTVSLAKSTWTFKANSLLMGRNFYGILRVEDKVVGKYSMKYGSDRPQVEQILIERSLYHGTIRHGLQFLAPELRRVPTAYFSPGSGVGLALRLKGERGPLRVGIAGLGAGTIAAYSRPGDHYTYYEINPLMVEFARNEFTYLSDSPTPVDVILGDARLSLERQEPQAYDLLAADAFSGDAVPVHLLTREAFALYFRHLKPDGVLAVDITNRYVNLEPVVRAEATYFGKQAVEVTNHRDPSRGISTATWILVTGDTALLNQPEIKQVGYLLPPGTDLPLWTDEYSSVFSVLK